MHKFFVSLIILLFSYTAYSQSITVSGKLIAEDDGQSVPGAILRLVSIKDTSVVISATSDIDGNYNIENVSSGFYRLKVNNIVFKPVNRLIRISADVNLGVIKLIRDVKYLKEVQVKSTVIGVETKGDTTLYNAEAYQTNPDANAADLVSKMPGITVDETGVQSNGETVEQVLLDGKRFFGQDPLLALNTIPAEVIDKVEVFDQQSERSQMTGVDDGNTTKTMNVVTYEDKRQGTFGKLQAGYGTDDRYKLEGNITKIERNKQLSILGMSNNVNQTNFTESDILGVGSRGRGRGRNRQFGSNNAGQTTGITETQSAGVNYAAESDKWKIESNYFLDKRTYINDAEASRETFTEQGNLLYDEASQYASVNLNHRINARISHNLSNKDIILFRPQITFQNNESLDVTQGEAFGSFRSNNTNNSYSGDNVGFNLGGHLLYTHKFSKAGRSISLDLNGQFNRSDIDNNFEDRIADSVLVFENDNARQSISSAITYAEPIGLSSTLQFSYALSDDQRALKRETAQLTVDNNRIPIIDLSNDFNSDYITHTPSINLLNRSIGNILNIGLGYQHAKLKSEVFTPVSSQVSNTFNALLPSVFSRFSLGNTDIFMRYNTATSAPSGAQLQEVLDVSNPLFYSIGNENLDQSYTHRLIARLSKNNTDKSRSFSSFILASYTNNYIGTKTIVANSPMTIDGVFLPPNIQLSRPVNFDGYWNARNNNTWGFPLSALKSTLNASLGLSYTRTPGLTNENRNISNNYSGSTRIGLSSNISDKIDFNVFYSLRTNLIRNSTASNSNNQFMTNTYGGKLSLTFLRDLVFRANWNYNRYNGISDEFDTNYFLLNMDVAKKMLPKKQAEVSLTIFDLLNQNQSITQTVNAIYIEENRSLILRQYFMLNFTYQIRQFGKG